MISFLAGLGLGLSLIVAIGAQNVFVLRQGIRREHVLPVVLVCAISDAALIVAGVAGLGYVLESVPWLVDAARWLGAVFLLGYGLLAAGRAWRGTGQGLETAEATGAGSAAEQETPETISTGGTVRMTQRTALAPVVLTVLALTWLNPHVYLDTVLMLGSIAATHGDARWLFACGAIVASAVWFTALGFGARYLGRWLSTPRAWRVLDALIAVVMIGIAVSLVMPTVVG
ncbi:LysE/ArgO family amino acid transporter [Microbacterium sp. CIAB417]|uniref:LysE/ArgO family amino acid transporter n=1 Tax=Microbacterium sp. CIAB417 TaxID=2860287 RepID=UPI001FAB7B1F|nr:LysE/ArgO family amino acid transporter [Microbacterium sp. CIAB417]